MHDDDTLRPLLRSARPDIADDGFTRSVMRRIDRARRRRRLVVAGFAGAGALIAAPPFVRVVLTLSAALPNHVTTPVVEVAALCASVLAVWLVCVAAES